MEFLMELHNSIFLFSFFHSKVSELKKISYDITIWLNSVLLRNNPQLGFLTRKFHIPKMKLTI